MSHRSKSEECSDTINNDSDSETIDNQLDSNEDNASFQIIEIEDDDIGYHNGNDITYTKHNGSGIQYINENVNHELDLNGVEIDKEMPDFLLKSNSTVIIQTNKITPKQKKNLQTGKPNVEIVSTVKQPSIALVGISTSTTPKAVTTPKVSTIEKVSFETLKPATTSKIKKSKDTKVAEEIMVKLCQTGQLPNTLDYNYLINKSSNSKENTNAIKNLSSNNNTFMNVKERQKRIQQFLHRTNIYLSQKQLNLDKISDRKNGIITQNGTSSNQTTKAKYATLEITYRTSQNTKPFKGKIRSPDQFKSDQDKFLKEKNRRLEGKRKEIEALKEKENKPKPTISAQSKKIAFRAHSSSEKRESVHNKLYDDMHERALSKEKQIKELLAHQDELKNKNKNKRISKEEINNVVEKLYKGGIEEKKKRYNLSIPCHMEEVNVFYSRDYSNYQSNIRTNALKQGNITDAIDDFYDMTRVICAENKAKNNKLIFMKKILKEIDDGLKTISFKNQLTQIKSTQNSIDMTSNNNNNKDKEIDNDKSAISFDQYSLLLFYIGMLQYNHSEFCSYITKNKPKTNEIGVDYNNIQWSEIKLDDVVIKHIPSAEKIAKSQMMLEYKKIKESWSLLAETNNNNRKSKEDNTNGNVYINIKMIKLFILSVIGIYPGESKIQNEKHSKPSSCSTSILTPNKKKLNKSILDYINNIITKTNPEIILDKKKVHIIYSSYESFRQNRTLFEAYFRNEKNKKKLFNYSSNREMTFKPIINVSSANNSHKIKASASQLKIEHSYEIMRKKKAKEIEMMQKEKELNEIKACTFKPNNHNIDKVKTIEISHRLYSNPKQKKNSNTTTTNKSKSNITKEEECTFSPKLNPPLSNRLFNKQSIKANPHVNSKVDQYQKARIEKKLIDFISKQGGMGLSKLKTSEDFLEFDREEENVKQFEFGIEKKSNKFTFEAFSNRDNANKRYNTRMNLPLFTIEVKIKNKIELLDYYKDDVSSVITKRFCKKHNLGESSKEKIISVIEEKLKSMEII